MAIPQPIRDNLRFLSAEVGSQVALLQNYFDGLNPSLGQRILDRSGYAYNLMIRIHNSCLNQLAERRRADQDSCLLRALESIATDLERISELCRDCVHQMSYLDGLKGLRAEAYGPLLERVITGIGLIEGAIDRHDTQLALEIGGIEAKLDRAYRRLQRRYTADLKRGKHTEALVSALFIAHNVEQMGDALLNISEAIISANLGQPINIDRYHSLRASVERLGLDQSLGKLSVERIAETRSGSGISGIAERGRKGKKANGYVAIFKEGKRHKLKEERDGVESWHEIFPGLAPRILDYKKRGQSAALLIEHLPGLTFEQILLHEPPKLLRQTLKRLQKTLARIWDETRSRKPAAADHMGQLNKRLEAVYTVHPQFRQGECRIGALPLPGFEALIERAGALEARLQAPFSVYIHGDFNLDNILYDPVERRINFIDLHRSRYMDYVQDVSVFMVSNYRLQVLDPPLRRRILAVCSAFYQFAAEYAAEAGDRSFELRLALGLARSFASSTRFILDQTLAAAMFLRARYLLELALASNPDKPHKFRLPIQEIFVG